MYTQIIAPCPIAWDAINKNRKIGSAIPPQFKINERLIKVSEIIYPIEPIYISTLLPNLSIRLIPINVKITLVSPMPMLLSSAALWPSPPSSNILGAFSVVLITAFLYAMFW